MPAIGVTPGKPPAGADDHLAVDLLAEDRLGLPTSSAPSGVIVAALRPKPHSAIAAAASWTTWFWSRAGSRARGRTSPARAPTRAGRDRGRAATARAAPARSRRPRARLSSAAPCRPCAVSEGGGPFGEREREVHLVRGGGRADDGFRAYEPAGARDAGLLPPRARHPLGDPGRGVAARTRRGPRHPRTWNGGDAGQRSRGGELAPDVCSHCGAALRRPRSCSSAIAASTASPTASAQPTTCGLGEGRRALAIAGRGEGELV